MESNQVMGHGKCRYWDPVKGYGFIRADDGRDFFSYWSDLNMSGFRRLHIGDIVNFDIQPVAGKPDKAVNVTVIVSNKKAAI